MQKIVVGLLTVIATLLTIVCYEIYVSDTLPKSTSPYQTVVLTNGQVYFGKLEQTPGKNFILRDVFYVLSQSDPETKQISNVLVRRGKELHEPEYMVLSRDHVIMIEPVGDKSRIAQLIAEQSKVSN